MAEQHHFRNLLDVVPADFLQDLLNRFSDATDVKTLITDNLGKPLIGCECSDLFCEFCTKIRANPKTRIECEKSDAFGGISAFHSGLPTIYRCHMDIVEVSVPIIINGQYLGVIMIGQLRVDKDEHSTIPKSVSSNIDLDSDPELKALYEKSVNAFPLVPLKKLRALTNMLHSIANYIAEISINNHLKDANQELNQRIREEESYKIKLEKSLKQKELRNIEMRLKPQHLFNVLNTINNLVLLENPQRASEVISSLSKLIRYNLRHADQFSTIAEEFESIQNYLTIKRISLDNRLSIQTSVAEDCLDAIIPPLSIQPLVEEAFTNSLEEKLEGGKFYLNICRLGNKIKIVVSNNGVGLSHISRSQLTSLKKSDLTNTDSLPLINVLKIMNHYFEDEFSWDVKSFENQGTTIDIMIPYWSKGGAVKHDPSYVS